MFQCVICGQPCSGLTYLDLSDDPVCDGDFDCADTLTERAAAGERVHFGEVPREVDRIVRQYEDE